MDAGKRAGKFERACLRERCFGFVEIVCLYWCSVTDTASSLFRAAERPGLARVREFAEHYESFFALIAACCIDQAEEFLDLACELDYMKFLQSLQAGAQDGNIRHRGELEHDSRADCSEFGKQSRNVRTAVFQPEYLFPNPVPPCRIKVQKVREECFKHTLPVLLSRAYILAVQ